MTLLEHTLTQTFETFRGEGMGWGVGGGRGGFDYLELIPATQGRF